MAGWLASCLSFMVLAGLSCSSITSACSNNLKQHSTEFSREPYTQINSEMPKPTQGVNYSRGGAGSEVSNRVYVIAVPVKKFGRVWLSANFPSKQLWDGECRHGRTTSFCSALSFQGSKHEEKVSLNFFNGPFGHQEACCMNSSWVTSLIGTSKSSVIFKLREFSSDQPAPSL